MIYENTGNPCGLPGTKTRRVYKFSSSVAITSRTAIFLKYYGVVSVDIAGKSISIAIQRMKRQTLEVSAIYTSSISDYALERFYFHLSRYNIDVIHESNGKRNFNNII